MKILAPFSLTLLLLLVSCSCFAETEIFQIKHRPADEVLPVVKAALSPKGRAVADRIGNMIIVNDTPETLTAVRTLLLSSDRRMPQVTVHMAFNTSSHGPASTRSPSGKRPGRHLSTENTVAQYAQSNQSRTNRSFITVSSGSSGYIRMARQVPVTEKWLFFCRRSGVPALLKETQTIETGMEVLPIASGNQVILTVTPRISWMINGRRDSFRFVEAATRLTMPRSEWTAIGGGMDSVSADDNDIMAAILSTSGSSTQEGFIIRIKADVK